MTIRCNCPPEHCPGYRWTIPGSIPTSPSIAWTISRHSSRVPASCAASGAMRESISLILGSSAATGFWKMSWTVRRNRLKSPGLIARRSRPSMITSPRSGRI